MFRFKLNRWLLVEFLSCPNPGNPWPGGTNDEQAHMYYVLKQSVIAHFGDTGWAAVDSSLTMKYFSSQINLCIIRVARDPHKIAWAGVTLTTTIDRRK